MHVVVQRVLNAEVTIEEKSYAKINKGLLVYVCFTDADNTAQYEWMLKKILQLRIFENKEAKFDCNVVDVHGSLLIIPNFTLCANIRKGNRPSFNTGILPSQAQKKFEQFVSLASSHIDTKTGKFGAYMVIHSTVYGPCNIIIHTPHL